MASGDEALDPSSNC